MLRINKSFHDSLHSVSMNLCYLFTAFPRTLTYKFPNLFMILSEIPSSIIPIFSSHQGLKVSVDRLQVFFSQLFAPEREKAPTLLLKEDIKVMWKSLNNPAFLHFRRVTSWQALSLMSTCLTSERAGFQSSCLLESLPGTWTVLDWLH